MRKLLLCICLAFIGLFTLLSCDKGNETLKAPTNLVVSEGVLSWDAVEGTSSYKLNYFLVGNEEEFEETLTVCEFDFNEFADGLYQGKVKAIGDGVESNYSISVQVLIQSEIDVINLETPTNISFDGEALTWDAVEGATGYILSIHNLDADTKFEEGVTTNEYVFENSGHYIINIKAFNNTSESLPSNDAEIIVGIIGLNHLEAPINLDIIDDVLTWNAVSGATEYIVSYHLVGEDEVEVSVDANEYEIELDTPGIYLFKVMAIDDLIESDWSVEMEYLVAFSLVLDVPQNVRVNDDTILWDAVANAESYLVRYIYTEDSDSEYVEIPVSNTFYALSLPVAGLFNISVKAINSELESNWSEDVEYFSNNATPIETPANLKVTDNELLTWDIVSGAWGYMVMVNDVLFNHVFEDTFANLKDAELIVAGRSHEISVKALAYDTVYHIDSVFSEVLEFDYVIEYETPQNVARNNLGQVSWDPTADLADGYTVSIYNMISEETTTTKVDVNSFDLSSLPDGLYEVRVKVNGYELAVESPYSDKIGASVTTAIEFLPTNIASFSSMNGASAALVGNIADVRGGQDWGGVVSPRFSLNYAKNPVLSIDYESVYYGYANNLYIGANLYNTGDKRPLGLEPFTANYDLKLDQNGVIPTAQGVVADAALYIGYTYAGSTSNAGRVTMKINGIKVIYIEEVTEIPDEPIKLDDPTNLNISGTTVSWSAVSGSFWHTPTYLVNIYKDDILVKTLEEYEALVYDLSNIDGGVVDGVYHFSVIALGDELEEYYFDSNVVTSTKKQLTVLNIDFNHYVANDMQGQSNRPIATVDGDRLKLTQGAGYGTNVYALPSVDVANTAILIDFYSIVGGNYYLRLLNQAGFYDSQQTIMSGDANATGLFSMNITDVAAYANLTGNHVLYLNIGLSGTNITCLINSIRLVTVSNVA